MPLREGNEEGVIEGDFFVLLWIGATTKTKGDAGAS